MGADLILAWIPAAKITDQRDSKFRQKVLELPDEDLEMIAEIECGGLEYDEEEANGRAKALDEIRTAILTAFDEYKGFPYRDMTSVMFPGMDYWMFVCGGMSWGDTPCDSYNDVVKVGGCDKLFNLLLRWARKDHEKANGKADPKPGPKNETAIRVRLPRRHVIVPDDAESK